MSCESRLRNREVPLRVSDGFLMCNHALYMRQGIEYMFFGNPLQVRGRLYHEHEKVCFKCE